MTQRRTNQTAQRLAQRLHRAATIIPTIETHLNQQTAHLTTIKANTTNPGGHTSDTPDPTWRTVAANATINQKRQAITDALATIELATKLLDDACRNALKHRTQPDDPRGTFEQNGEPICRAFHCDQPASSYTRQDGTIGYRSIGLCESHRRRTYRQDETS